jgi:hypothetical protein
VPPGSTLVAEAYPSATETFGSPHADVPEFAFSTWIAFAPYALGATSSATSTAALLVRVFVRNGVGDPRHHVLL